MKIRMVFVIDAVVSALFGIRMLVAAGAFLTLARLEADDLGLLSFAATVPACSALP